MKRLRALAATLGATAVLLVAASPANAHSVTYFIDGGYGAGLVNASHNQVQACDFEADGWGVRTHYEMIIDGRFVARTVGDANGSQRGCGVHNTPFAVIAINACAGIDGADWQCTGWHNV